MNFKGFKIPKEAQRGDSPPNVQWYLTTKYNQVAKGTSYAPQIIISSHWLRDRYEETLEYCQRFVFSADGNEEAHFSKSKVLVFKCARYYGVDWLKGWDVKFL